MLLIVAHHYVVNSGLFETNGPIYSNGFNAKSIFLLLFGMWGKTGINCFLMITGYYMCKSSISLKKLLRLLLEIYFYKFCITSIFWITGYAPFSIKKLLLMLLPTTSVTTNFMGCYLLFYLTIPFLNILLNNIDKKQHRLLIGLCMLVYVVFGTFKRVLTVNMNYVSWFIVIYFVASYIRLRSEKVWDNEKLWNWLLFGLIVIDIVSVIGCFYISLRSGAHKAYYFVSDSNTFLALATGIAAFMVFRNLDLKYSRIINWFASSTFGVLCIHANSDTMRQWLWKDFLNCVGFYSSPWILVHAMGSVIGIFVVCVLIDKVRIKLFEKPLMARL